MQHGASGVFGVMDCLERQVYRRHIVFQQTEVQQAWMKDYGLGPPVEGEAWFNQNVLNRLDVVRNEDCLSVFCPEAVDEILH